MKKYFLTALFSLLIIVGVSFVLTATEKDRKSCCSSAKVENTQTSSVEAAEATAVSCTGEAKVATTETSAGASSCCASKATPTSAAAGECTKVPAGTGSQRANSTL
jgi:hypothetical protein